MAALSLAGTRFKEYVHQLLPGFDEHYERAQHRLGGIKRSEIITSTAHVRRAQVGLRQQQQSR